MLRLILELRRRYGVGLNPYRFAAGFFLSQYFGFRAGLGFGFWTWGLACWAPGLGFKGSDLRGEGIGITKSWLSGGERASESLLFFCSFLSSALMIRVLIFCGSKHLEGQGSLVSSLIAHHKPDSLPSYLPNGSFHKQVSPIQPPTYYSPS